MSTKKIIAAMLVSIFIVVFLSISFASSSSLDLYVGESIKLNSKLFDGSDEINSSDILWKSSDTNVATVDSSGTIVAKGQGSAEIKATVNTGTHIKEAYVLVNVKSTIKSIKIKTPNKKIFVGEDFVVEYEIVKSENLRIPANTKVTFLSTSPEIASVDSEGRVKGLKEGSVSILVTSVDGGKRDYITVDVSSMVTKVDILDKEKTVYVGEEFTVPFKIEPASAMLKDLNWSSFDSAIVSVKDNSNGTLKALKDGNAYIRAISVDGEKQDTIHIFVKSLLKGIVLNDKKIELNDNNKSFMLTFKLIPKYENIIPIEKGVTYKSSDTSIASVDNNGIVTALKSGLVRIDATTVDGLYSDYCIIDSKVTTPKVITAKKTYPKSIKLINMPTRVLVGEKVPVKFEINPISVSENNVKVSVLSSLGYKITSENGVDYFIPTHEGASRIRVTTANGLTDEVNIFSESTIKSAKIDTGFLHEKYNRYEVYLGQTGQLKPILKSSSNSSKVILDTVKWKSDDNSIISIDTLGNFKVLKNGRAKITMTSDDSELTDTVSFEVEPMLKKIKLQSQVTIGLSSEFQPNVSFELNDDVLYDYKDVINRNIDLTIEETYITKEFLKIEKAYEEKTIDELEKKIQGRSSSMNELLESLQKKRIRLIVINYFLDKSSGDYVRVNYGSQVLTDRDGNSLKIVEIKDNKLYGYIVGYVKLKVVSNDSAKEDNMRVNFDDTVKSIIIYDELGKVVSTSDTSATDEIKKTQEELRQKLEEEQKLKEEADLKEKKDSILLAYKGKLASDIPSDWALVNVDEFSEKIEYVGILNNFRKDITREEFAEIAVNLYQNLTGKKLKTIYNNYFTDTDNKFVTYAYQLGIVNGTDFRKFSPKQTITRQEMALMLDKVLKASGKELDKESLGSENTSFDDEDKMSSWAKESIDKLSKEYKVFSGVGSNKFNPLGNASREQAIVLAMKIINNIK
ncbi:Ig-like domain-containing protein [Helicovermis profundi]|uniref:SLH domain-containing protein n=1 Tax=Helicovermis profundi TaxID=3065157 RepID=A0AAU9EFK4_9FIRM|nr:hypothetical protein HLPR_26200 [Clostridia bacterium S502]